MARKISQAQRVAAEQSQRSAKVPDIVETRYRLQPEDLTYVRRMQIRAVTSQGIESVTPLLHLDGAPKPLALTPDDIRTLVLLTGSPVYNEWPGHEVELRIVRRGDRHVIGIFAPGTRVVDEPLVQAPPPRRRLSTAVLFLLFLAAAALSVYLVEQGPALWTSLQESWPEIQESMQSFLGR